jgi:hypothetical protein
MIRLGRVGELNRLRKVNYLDSGVLVTDDEDMTGMKIAMNDGPLVHPFHCLKR